MSGRAQKKSVRVKPKSASLSITPSRSSSTSMYEKDFYKWAADQSKLLRKEEFSKLDIENLIEEIDALGRSEKRALESHFRKLLSHLLKIKYQPSHHTSSWDITVKLARIAAKEILADNPSLKPKAGEIFTRAYTSARLEAAAETKLEENTFPKKCPWTQEECMSESESSGKQKKDAKPKHKVKKKKV